MKSRLKLGGGVFAGVAALFAASSSHSANRIVSNNLCADQYVLALSEPHRIAGLSPLAADADVSYHHLRARNFNRMGDDLETVLLRNPDLVVSSVYASATTTHMLTQRQIALAAVREPTILSEVPAELRRVGAVIDASAEAEQAARTLETYLAETAGLFSGRALTALIYERGGYTQSSSLTAAMLEHFGISNANASSGRNGFAAVSVEDLIAMNPSIVVFQDMPYDTDQGAVLNAHPALLRHFPKTRQIKLPLALTICAGPATLAALTTLKAQLQEKLNATR